jgi:hypothetical protein
MSAFCIKSMTEDELTLQVSGTDYWYSIGTSPFDVAIARLTPEHWFDGDVTDEGIELLNSDKKFFFEFVMACNEFEEMNGDEPLFN